MVSCVYVETEIRRHPRTNVPEIELVGEFFRVSDDDPETFLVVGEFEVAVALREFANRLSKLILRWLSE